MPTTCSRFVKQEEAVQAHSDIGLIDRLVASLICNNLRVCKCVPGASRNHFDCVCVGGGGGGSLNRPNMQFL